MRYANIIRRVLAYLIDCILVFAVLFIAIQNIIFLPIRHFFIGSEEWFESGWNTEAYTLLTISLLVWLYFILFEISPWQATIGKRLFKLKTVAIATEQRISLKKSIVRTIIKLLPWEIAHFTNNIPIPMWYDPNPGFRFGFAIVPLIILVYLVVAKASPTKQGPHDYLAKTVVLQEK